MDESIERQLDKVDREAVFAEMRMSGWGTQDTPPRWVWLLAIQKVREEKTVH